ncbi:MAG: hypothetical protein J5J00_12460 [Deltaproteobacteria bacterium]|nr:hypothetical protein [Deltaproteobacteria bacterium]
MYHRYSVVFRILCLVFIAAVNGGDTVADSLDNADELPICQHNLPTESDYLERFPPLNMVPATGYGYSVPPSQPRAYPRSDRCACLSFWHSEATGYFSDDLHIPCILPGTTYCKFPEMPPDEWCDVEQDQDGTHTGCAASKFPSRFTDKFCGFPDADGHCPEGVVGYKRALNCEKCRHEFNRFTGCHGQYEIEFPETPVKCVKAVAAEGIDGEFVTNDCHSPYALQDGTASAETCSGSCFYYRLVAANNCAAELASTRSCEKKRDLSRPVTIIAPEDGAQTSTQVSISTAVLLQQSEIAGIDFYSDGIRLGSSDAEYGGTFVLPSGLHSLTARVTLHSGHSINSDPVFITVFDEAPIGTAVPQVSLVVPNSPTVDAIIPTPGAMPMLTPSVKPSVIGSHTPVSGTPIASPIASPLATVAAQPAFF